MASTELTAVPSTAARAAGDTAVARSANSQQWDSAVERCRALEEDAQGAADAAEGSVEEGAGGGDAAGAPDGGNFSGHFGGAAPGPAVGLAPLAAAFHGVAGVAVADDRAASAPVAGRAAIAPGVAALAFTAQTLMCLENQTGIAKIDFQCQVRGGLLDGAVLHLSADPGHGAIDSVVVRLPRQRWHALAAQRSELTRALGSAVGHGVAVDIVTDEAA